MAAQVVFSTCAAVHLLFLLVIASRRRGNPLEELTAYIVHFGRGIFR